MKYENRKVAQPCIVDVVVRAEVVANLQELLLVQAQEFGGPAAGHHAGSGGSAAVIPEGQLPKEAIPTTFLHAQNLDKQKHWWETC